jgi:WD40 repeat protein
MRLFTRLCAATFAGGPVLLLSLSAQDKSGVVFKGHTEAIYSAAFTKDGTLAATGSFDKSVRLWDPATGKQLREFAGPSGHQSLVLSVAFSPNGDQVASGGSDNTARVWDVPLSKPVRELAHGAGVTAVAVSPDGKSVAGAAADGSVKVWSADGKPIATLTGHPGGATGVLFSANNAVLATCGIDGTARLWNPADGKPTGVIGAHGSGVTAMAIGPANNQLYTVGADGLLKFWQFPVPAPKALPAHSDAITSLTLSADGNSALTGGADRAVKLSNVANGQLIREFTGATAGITATALWPNNATVAAGTADGKAFLWTADGKPAGTLIAHAGAVTGIAANPNGTGFVTVGADGMLRSWAYPVNPTRTIASPAAILGGSLSPDGKHLVTAGADGVVRTWAYPAGTPEKQFTGHTGAVHSTAITPDNATVVSVGADEKLHQFSAANGMQTAALTGHKGAINSVALAPNGQFAVTGGADGTVRIWGPLTAAAKETAKAAHSGPVRQVLVTPDSGRVLSIGDDKHLRIWDAKTGKEQRAIPVGEGPIGLAMTSDASKVATAGADKVAKVWTIAEGKAITSVSLPGPAQAVAISPNGARLAVAFNQDKANRLRVYDVASGREVQALPDAAGPVRSLAFLADNRTLIAAGEDKAVTVHDVAVTAAFPVQPGGVVGMALHPSAPQAITAGADKTVKLWDLNTGKEVKTLATLPEPITSLTVSRDFAAFAVSAGKAAKAWQLSDGKELVSIAHSADVLSVGFSADRTRLVTGSADHVARVWEVATGRLVQSFAHTGPVRGVAMHPSQPLVVTASADKTAGVHTIGLTRTVAASAKPLRAVTVTANGSHVVTAGDDGLVRAFNAGNGNEERKFEGATGPVHAVAVSKNAQVLAAAGADKMVRLYTFNDAKEIGTIPASAAVRGLAFSADGKLLAGAGEDRTVTVWNVAFQPGQPLPEGFGKPVQQFAHGDAATAVAFAEKGELYTGSADKTVRQWKVAANAPTRTFQHPNLVDAVAWSPDGKLLATACHDGNVRIFDVEKNAATKTIAAHTTPQPAAVYSVTWTADGKQLLSTSYDKSMKLWDATSGSLVREFKPFAEKGNEKGHTDQVFCAAITKDGRLIASGSSDRKIKLWDAASGAVVREFPNPNLKGEPGQSHPGGVYQLRFTPDEKYLVSAGPAPKNRGYVAVWTVADGKLAGSLDVANGPVFGLALTPDGKSLLLGCGPKVRQVAEAEAVLVPLPVKP